MSTLNGARPGHTRTTVHAMTVAPTITSTGTERRNGQRAITWPTATFATIEPATNRVRSKPASVGLRRSPTTRKGYPQSSAKTVPENCVTKCVHRPSRVPGSRHARASPAVSRPAPCSAAAPIFPSGALRIPAALAAAIANAINAASSNERAQPSLCSSATSG